MKKRLSFLLGAAMLAFLVLSPTIIAAGIGKNIYDLKRNEREEDYCGTIEFWHIVTFKTPEGSGYEYLKTRCTRFERNTPYVFVTLRGMTPEEARRRMDAGEAPDIISFPNGMFSEENMLSYTVDEAILSCFAEERALPYMMDSYCLAVNRDLLREVGAGSGFMFTAEAFAEAYQRLSEAGVISIAVTETVGLSPERVLAAPELPTDSDATDFAYTTFPSEPDVQIGQALFLSREAGMYICPYSEYVKLKEAGFSFDATAYPVGGNTDIVQRLGIYDSGDAQKNEMLVRLVRGYFTPSMQRNLEKLGMLPCIRLEGLYETDAERAESYRRIAEKNVPFA